jgi:hypothetical protein
MLALDAHQGLRPSHQDLLAAAGGSPNERLNTVDVLRHILLHKGNPGDDQYV